MLRCAWPACAEPSTDSLLTELNEALAHKKEYDGQRLNHIAVLTADFASSEVNDDAKFDLGVRIYDEYKAFKYDSAFAYCQRITRLAAQLRSPAKLEVAKLKLAFELLLVSAIADVKTATKEPVAIFKRSGYSYRRGDLKNACAFIRKAREDAVFYKGRLRQLEISHVSSIIEGQKINTIERQRKTAQAYAIAVSVLALVVIGFAFVRVRQLRKLKRAGRLIFATNRELQERNGELRQLNSGLEEANKIKEEYIGFYFHNSSQYIDKIENLKKKLDVLLDTKQYAGALKLVDGIHVKHERDELLKGFDTVFLRLFPHFIAQFNALFGEADRVQLPDDRLLNTELRIFALIRLGIADSEQISRMLGYSINTIYTYETRVKNWSFVPNDEFEARILAIQTM